MFGRKKTATATMELPEALVEARTRYAASVQVVADLQQKRCDRKQELRDLTVKLGEIKAKINELPLIKHHALVNAERDPSKQSEVEAVNQRLTVLEAELKSLIEVREGVENELPALEKKITGALVTLERHRANVWEEVLSALVANAPPGLHEWLSKTWAAAQLVRRGSPVNMVLDRTGWTEPNNLAHSLEELRAEFSLPNG